MIPSKINGVPVVRITGYYSGNRYVGAFKNMELSSVVIPNSVSIIDNSFNNGAIDFVNIKGNSYIGAGSFRSDYMISKFNYGGTCAELNSYPSIFWPDCLPLQIITSDTTSCVYNNFNND